MYKNFHNQLYADLLQLDKGPVFDLKHSDYLYATQETQRQPEVVAVAIEKPLGFCVTNYNGDGPPCLYPNVMTVSA